MEPQGLNPLIKRAILACGRQSDLAAAMGCAQQTISKLLHNEMPVSAEWAAAIERATGGIVLKHDLRPDVFGAAPPRAEPQEATP